MKKYNFKTKLFSNSSESNKLSFTSKQQHPKGFKKDYYIFKETGMANFHGCTIILNKDAAFCYVYMLAKKIW